ncbi:MAG TPA: hypothetical protein VLS89_06950, partial [Candidatus Nanopelagicales bacterium]|nr:hypothetical protein [Candidatus Nanopelagicales bacterium]
RTPSSGVASAPPASERLDDAPSLREEADMVEAAEAELRNGHDAVAEELLEQHARAFPRGRLAAKRQRLLIELRDK